MELCHPGIRASEYPGPSQHPWPLESRRFVLTHCGRDDSAS